MSKSFRELVEHLQMLEDIGNKTFHAYHTGTHEGKEVSHYTAVKAYNRDEAHHKAMSIMKKKHPGIKEISADHIGTEKLAD